MQPPAGAGDAADVRGRQRAAAQDVLQHFAGQVDEAAQARRLGHGLLRQRLHHLHWAVDRRRHLVRVPGAAARSRVRFGETPFRSAHLPASRGGAKARHAHARSHTPCARASGECLDPLKGKVTRFRKITGLWALQP